MIKLILKNVSGGTYGVEVPFPAEDDELMRRLRRIGVGNSLSPDCRVMAVTGEAEDALNGLVGKNINADEMNYLARRFESFTEYELMTFQAIVLAEKIESLKEMINVSFDTGAYTLVSDFSDPEAIGRRNYLDIHTGVPVKEMESIDFKEKGSQLIEAGNGTVTKLGVVYKNRDIDMTIYQGTVFPEYQHEEDSVLEVVLKNRKGENGYLFLPTHMSTVQKTLLRLGEKRLRDCESTMIWCRDLPENIITLIGKEPSIELVNELCQTVKDFGETEMSILGMVAEHTKADRVSAVTRLAKQLNTFEVLPGICNAKDYGRYLVEEPGFYVVDESLLPFIDYESFAKSKMSPANYDSGFTDRGYVGTDGNVPEMLSYNGEFREPLEILAEETELLRLYNPLSCQMLYGDEEDDVQEELADCEVAKYEQEIRDALTEEIPIVEQARGLMHYFTESRAVAGKVLSAFPTIEEYGGILYGVLECRIREPLTPEELDILKDYWSGQASDGFGEGFEQRAIETEDGELYVSFWNSGNDFFIETEEEFNAHKEMKQMPGMEMQ